MPIYRTFDKLTGPAAVRVSINSSRRRKGLQTEKFWIMEKGRMNPDNKSVLIILLPKT
jgi:hypothetical protein